MEWIQFQERQLCHLFYLHSEKGDYSKRKEFSRLGRQFFPFSIDLVVSEGVLYVGKHRGNHKSCLPYKNGRKFSKCIQS